MLNQYEDAGHAAGIIIGLTISLILSVAIIASLFLPFGFLGISPVVIMLSQSIFALNAFSAAIICLNPNFSKNQGKPDNPFPEHKNAYPIYFGAFIYFFTYPFGWLGKKIGRLCGSPSPINKELLTSTPNIINQLEVTNATQTDHSVGIRHQQSPAIANPSTPSPMPEPDQAQPLHHAKPW